MVSKKPETTPWRTADRDRGILTKSDREYLLGERELDGQDKRNARYRIRNRLKQSLLDMALLMDEFSLSDYRQVIADEQISNDWIPIALIAHAHAFLYCSDGIVDPGTQMEQWIERAMGWQVPKRGQETEDGMIELIDVHAKASIEFTEEKLDIREYIPEEVQEEMTTEEMKEWFREAIREHLEEQKSK